MNYQQQVKQLAKEFVDLHPEFLRQSPGRLEARQKGYKEFLKSKGHEFCRNTHVEALIEECNWRNNR